MKETEEIMGMIKEEGAAYFARERGNKVEVGLYLEHIIEERGMKKKDIVRKLNLEESYARKLFGGQRIPTRKILLQCAFLLSLNLSDTQRLLDIGQKPRLYPRVRYDAAIIYGLEEKMTLEEMNSFLDEIGEDCPCHSTYTRPDGRQRSRPAPHRPASCTRHTGRCSSRH